MNKLFFSLNTILSSLYGFMLRINLFFINNAGTVCGRNLTPFSSFKCFNCLRYFIHGRVFFLKFYQTMAGLRSFLVNGNIAMLRRNIMVRCSTRFIKPN